MDKNKIIFVGGQKGGVGKSFATKSLVEYFWHRRVNYQLIEADQDNPDVAIVYDKERLPDIYDQGLSDTGTNNFSLTPCEYIGFSDSKYRIAEPDVIFTSALDRITIVNLPSNVEEQVNNWLNKSDILGLKEEYDVELYKLFLTDGSYSSIKLLYTSLKEHGEDIHHVLVKNLGRVTGGANFEYLYKDEEFEKAVSKFDIEDVNLPMLYPQEQFFLDKNGLTFLEGKEILIDEPGYGIVSAQRVVNFRKEVFAMLEGISFLEDIVGFNQLSQSKDKDKDNKANEAA